MRPAALVLLALTLAALAGCDDMTKQRKPHPYRDPAGDPAPTAPGTVQSDDAPAPPPKLSLTLIAQGQSQYRAFCVPCHAETGDGHGMIVARGFAAPLPFWDTGARALSSASMFGIITNGQGAMYSFAQRIAPADRWAIVAYMRALQRSQSGSTADLSAAELAALRSGASGKDAENGQGSVPWASTSLPPPP